MSPQVRLDPSLPACWESPDTLRIGFERVIARIERPSIAAERFLQQLRRGARFDSAGPRLADISEPEWRGLIDSLTPAFIDADSSTENADRHPPTLRLTPPAVVLLGDAAVTRVLANVLGQVGCTILTSREPEYLLQRGATLITTHSFLASDHDERSPLVPRLPQLPIRLTDQSVWIGPFVTPGGSPCARCAALHEVDADPGLSIAAAQLIGRPSLPLSLEVGWRIAGIILTALSHAAPHNVLAHSRIQLPITRGVPALALRLHPLMPHPDCWCQHTEVSDP